MLFGKCSAITFPQDRKVEEKGSANEKLNEHDLFVFSQNLSCRDSGAETWFSIALLVVNP